MDTQRSSPDEAASSKILWAGGAVVVIIVLVMGASLIHMQAQPGEPRRVDLPVLEAPPAIAPPAFASAATAALTPAAPVPPASAAADPLVNTDKPRIVHPSTSEPAVARAPQRPAS
ncbi:MAG: hypothetical protein K9J76_00905 [Polaromonas sp.]|nr:hypothetical protein [Polaromonas sp.]